MKLINGILRLFSTSSEKEELEEFLSELADENAVSTDDDCPQWIITLIENLVLKKVGPVKLPSGDPESRSSCLSFLIDVNEIFGWDIEYTGEDLFLRPPGLELQGVVNFEGGNFVYLKVYDKS